MSCVRYLRLACALALIALASANNAWGVSIPTPNKPTVLSSGVLVVQGELNGEIGRPDTLIGQFDPAFSKPLGPVNDNTPGVGDGKGSQLHVPLMPNGSAYFRVTGNTDTKFNGLHLQSGRYSIQYDLYNAAGQLYSTLPLQYEDVVPTMFDNIWLDPPDAAHPDPQRAGGSVTVTINNVVGAGKGNSLAFYQFTGLQPNQPFTADLSSTGFDGLLGLYDGPNTLLKVSEAGTPVLTGFADLLGRVLIGVTGQGDVNFTGQHFQTGAFTLALQVVPEPSSVVLLGLGAGLALVAQQARRRKRASAAKTPSVSLPGR